MCTFFLGQASPVVAPVLPEVKSSWVDRSEKEDAVSAVGQGDGIRETFQSWCYLSLIFEESAGVF